MQQAAHPKLLHQSEKVLKGPKELDGSKTPLIFLITSIGMGRSVPEGRVMIRNRNKSRAKMREDAHPAQGSPKHLQPSRRQ
ncbi:hypothetical protein QG37_07106 [Candidozyma auris]|nr:hypothetical protein QG37_07106 [[Candida] auris]